MSNNGAESHHRLYTVTPNDHTAYIVIGTAVGMAYLPIFGLIRYFVRRATETGADDILLLCSTILAFIQSALLLGACSHGLGRSVTLTQTDRVEGAEQLYYASTILWLLSLAASKASTASLLLRLGVTKEHKTAFRAILGFVVLWGVASISALALQCNLSRPWALLGSQCPNRALRWQIVSAFDILFEVAVPIASAAFVWPLKAGISTKINVVFAFSFRLVLIIIIILRLINFPQQEPSSDPMLRLDLFAVWSQTQMNWSVISATIPSLRPFLHGLSTYTEGLGGSSTDPNSQRIYASGHELSDLRSGPSDRGHYGRRSQINHQSNSNGSRGFFGTMGNGIKKTGHSNTATVVAQRRPDADEIGSMNSGDSQNMIIQKDVQFAIDWNSADTDKHQ